MQNILHQFLPNGQHYGNLWISPPFPSPEPERGRYSLICEKCHGIDEGYNWRVSSPENYCHDGRQYLCHRCIIVVYRNMPYKEYLKTAYWYEVREQALRDAKGRCQLCSSPTDLEVHHNNYWRRGRERPEDVIALCANCHTTHHRALRKGTK